MKLLTFLGTVKYDPTIYTWRDQEYPASFAPAASCRFLQPDQLIVFLSEEAEEKVFPAFQQALPPELPVQPLPVPLGRDELELWRIFEQISSAVAPGESVAFDITHGLRSYPLIGLLAAAFLKSGLRVRLEAVLYGAFDVGKTVSPGRTPFFDLSPMLSLLEWAAAADRFERTGDARYLASLVNSQRKQLALEAQGDPALLRQVGDLGSLAGALTSISQSLRLIRPHQAMEQVAGLPERTRKAQPALERATPARPFSLLLDHVVQAYQPLAHPKPLGEGEHCAVLEAARVMIHWYADREQWVQAVSLAREWLVSWVMVQLGYFNFTQLSARQRVENVVGAEAKDFQIAKTSNQPFRPFFLAGLTDVNRVLALWLALTDVRNDIDHAGMREDPGKPEDLIQRIRDCLIALDGLPLSPSNPRF